MYPVRQNAATQSRPAKSIRVLDVCPKCVLPELMRSIYSKWLRKGFFSLPRQCSHRKNASAAKPQEAVQADRPSSKRKSLIFSSLPQKQAFACRQTQRHSRKNPISSLFGLCPLYHILAIKQACGLAAENPPAANPASAETLFLFIQRDGMVFILGPGGIRPHRYPLILQQLIHLGD